MVKNTSAINKSVVLKSLFLIIFIVALIYLCAGKWLYWQDILYCALMISMFIVSYLFIAHNPGLINGRLKPEQGAKAWNKTHLTEQELSRG